MLVFNSNANIRERDNHISHNIMLFAIWSRFSLVYLPSIKSRWPHPFLRWLLFSEAATQTRWRQIYNPCSVLCLPVWKTNHLISASRYEDYFCISSALRVLTLHTAFQKNIKGKSGSWHTTQSIKTLSHWIRTHRPGCVNTELRTTKLTF